jgi:1-acyl-sn-glycerol-3-phosphate acyltransferase
MRIRTRLRHAWQVVGTGASFAFFGLAALVLVFLVFPLYRLRGDAEAARRSTQRTIQRTFRVFIRFMDVLRVVRVEVRHAERLLEPGQMIVANHPTLLDVVMIVALVPELDVVVKREAWSNPFMRGVVTAADYVPNDTGGEVVDACAERLCARRSVLLFPEGTRSPKGGLGPFRRGAAHAALTAGRPIRPVVVTCSPPSLGRGQPWYETPAESLRFEITVGEAVDPTVLADDLPRGAAARRITRALRDFYLETLQYL